MAVNSFSVWSLLLITNGTGAQNPAQFVVAANKAAVYAARQNVGVDYFANPRESIYNASYQMTELSATAWSVKQLPILLPPRGKADVNITKRISQPLRRLSEIFAYCALHRTQQRRRAPLSTHFLPNLNRRAVLPAFEATDDQHHPGVNGMQEEDIDEELQQPAAKLNTLLYSAGHVVVVNPKKERSGNPYPAGLYWLATVQDNVLCW